MAFGEACWAAIEGNGGAGLLRQRRKMSDEQRGRQRRRRAMRGEVDVLEQVT